MGYAEGGETISPNKRDRDGSENGPYTARNPNNDAQGQEEDRHDSTSHLENGRQISIYGSPELRRREPQSRSYLDGTSNTVSGSRDTAMVKKETGGYRVIHRESAIYDDEGQGPLGMLVR